MGPIGRSVRILPPLGTAFAMLAAPACDVSRTAEFQVKLRASPSGGRATQEEIGRVLERRAKEAGLGAFSLKWTSATTCVVRLAGVQDLQHAAQLIEFGGVLEFRWTDTQNRFRESLPAIDRALTEAGFSASRNAARPTTIEHLLDLDTGSGVDDPTPARGPPGALGTLVYAGSIPGEFLVAEEDFPRADSLIHLPVVERAIPQEIELLWASEPVSQGALSYRPLYAVARDPVVTGEQLLDATANIDPASRQTLVLFTLTRDGGRRFSQETRTHVNEFLAIVLDGRVFRQPPVIRSEIGRDGQIDLGSASVEEAQDLALVLRAGALPVPLSVVQAAWVDE